MRNDRDLEGLSECRYLAGLTDAAHAVRVELDVVDRVRLEQLAKSKDRKLVFSTGDGNSPIALELFVAAGVIGNYRLFEPAKVEWLKQRQHPLRIVQCPSHVCVGHQV